MVAFMADKPRSSAKSSGAVKKLTSATNVRTSTDGESGDISLADKKRNKLGYHRTAVACGHCRRRKIRCIPSNDTTSTRCQNCIRLKKDCQFYPVDQNTVPQPKRIRSESKGGDVLSAESETSVSSSSPRIHNGLSTMDPYDQFRPPIETVPLSQGSDEYSQAYDHRHWYQGEHQQQPYWLQHDSTHTSSFAPSPYPITPTTTTGQTLPSHEHAYTYPAISIDHSNYTYPPPRPRDGPLASQDNPVPSFTGFRAHTMPNRVPISEETQRDHNVHQNPINLPSQQLNGQSYSTMTNSPSHYIPSTTHQVWMPTSSVPQQHAAMYAQYGAQPTWYNHHDGLSHMKGDELPSSQDPVSQDSHQFRPKPG